MVSVRARCVPGTFDVLVEFVAIGFFFRNEDGETECAQMRALISVERRDHDAGPVTEAHIAADRITGTAGHVVLSQSQ